MADTKLANLPAATTPLAGTELVYIVQSGDDAKATAQDLVNVPRTPITQTDFIAGVIEAPEDQDYRLIVNLPYAITITSVTTIAASGTCTATFKINTTALGGTANSVSDTESEQAHSSANVAAIGDDIVVTVSANSSCVDMSFCIKFTRELA